MWLHCAWRWVRGGRGGEGCQALVRDRRTTHHNPGWREDGWSRMEASGLWHRLAFSTLHRARCTWLHYFSSLAGNRQWCLRASKTTWWIINAQDLKKKKKSHCTLLMYLEHPLNSQSVKQVGRGALEWRAREERRCLWKGEKDILYFPK